MYMDVRKCGTLIYVCEEWWHTYIYMDVRNGDTQIYIYRFEKGWHIPQGVGSIGGGRAWRGRRRSRRGTGGVAHIYIYIYMDVRNSGTHIYGCEEWWHHMYIWMWEMVAHMYIWM
jgi:hypothetical protein